MISRIFNVLRRDIYQICLQKSSDKLSANFIFNDNRKITLEGKHSIKIALDVLTGKLSPRQGLDNFVEGVPGSDYSQYPITHLLRHINPQDKTFLNPEVALQCRLYLESKTSNEEEFLEAENAFFESWLALSLAYNSTNLDLLPVVKKASQQILKLIDQKEPHIRRLLANKTHFDNLLNDLYRDNKRGALGAIEKPHTDITIDLILADIREVLTTEEINLLKIMPIHSVFGYRIMQPLYKEDYLEIKSRYKVATDYVASAKKFVTTKMDDKDIPLTQQLGLATDQATCNIIDQLNEVSALSCLMNLSHRNSLQRFQVDKAKLRDFQANIHHMPFRAGPSSHSISLFTAFTLNSLKLSETPPTQAEYMEYALAYFSYLGSAGYHSFWEVMKVASICANASYVDGEYFVNLPAEIQRFIAKWNTQSSIYQENKQDEHQPTNVATSPRFFNNKLNTELEHNKFDPEAERFCY